MPELGCDALWVVPVRYTETFSASRASHIYPNTYSNIYNPKSQRWIETVPRILTSAEGTAVQWVPTASNYY